jgi:hypothetical protein
VDPELFVQSGYGSESGTFYVKKYDLELLEKSDPDPDPWQKFRIRNTDIRVYVGWAAG